MSSPHSKPLFSQEFLEELQSGPAQISMESLLCPGTQHTQKVVCAFQECGLHFPQSDGAPEHKPHWLSMSYALGLFLPMPDPQLWGPNVGLRTLTPVGVSL